ncbi:Cytokinesis protein sepH [Penicillium diatomitis]|uniref:Cytokinesis protein sepH n=1 Tax=Penicillium diatomitis TaxID=2819901 RepID=A0A9W9WTI3_9EURO|nr:Cytokinesis protein sepH [Penicillium diatomitis]KAJ5474953.1 Cytokinesis protein sepH [Penicillium diatomitis]
MRRPRPAVLYKENSVEDYSDLIMANEDVLDRSSEYFTNWTMTLTLRHTTKTGISRMNWLAIIRNYENSSNIARDKYARLRNQVEDLVGSLKTSQDEDVLAEISEQLLTVVVNAIIYNDYEIQENPCFVGGIPIQMFQTSTLTLQMFISAGGLNVLVEFLEDDYEDERDLVLIGVNGICRVCLSCRDLRRKTIFARILSRNSVLDPLSLVLSRVLDEDGELAEVIEGRIANTFFIFSQAENHVKEMVAERTSGPLTVLAGVLKELRRMSPVHQVTMLKFIQNLSMLSTTLDALQNSNAIDVLTELLQSTMGRSHFREVSNQILNTIYNMSFEQDSTGRRSIE